MRRLENEEEDKFWEAWIKDDLIFCYRYGKIGSNGHTKLKKFKTRAEAEAELEEKLAEKLEEGFEEPDAEEAEEAEDQEAAEEEADEAEEKEAEEDGEDEEAEAADEDEESEETEDKADGDSDDDDDDGDDDDDDDDEEAKPARRVRHIPAAEVDAPVGPTKPALPQRVRPRSATPEAIAEAQRALDAMKSAVGIRSWKLGRLARTARRSLERLGSAVESNAPLAAAIDAVMARVIAPKKALPLEDALLMLWVCDAATFARTVKHWRAKMLDSAASPAIGILFATLESVPDPEVALHVGAALVNRRISHDAFRRWFLRLRPFLEAELAKNAKGGTVNDFLGRLKPGSDTPLAERIREVRT